MIDLNKVSNLIEDLRFVPEYGEPGYGLNGKDGILLANWNDVDSKLADVLGYHFQLEYPDEWVEIKGEVYRTQPDSYFWKPSYINHDGELMIADDLDDAETVCEIFADDPDRAIPFDLDLASLGFELIDTGFENGFHRGQTDDPAAILRKAKRENPDREYVFTIDQSGQFDIRFSIWAYMPD